MGCSVAQSYHLCRMNSRLLILLHWVLLQRQTSSYQPQLASAKDIADCAIVDESSCSSVLFALSVCSQSVCKCYCICVICSQMSPCWSPPCVYKQTIMYLYQSAQTELLLVWSLYLGWCKAGFPQSWQCTAVWQPPGGSQHGRWWAGCPASPWRNQPPPALWRSLTARRKLLGMSAGTPPR